MKLLRALVLWAVPRVLPRSLRRRLVPAVYRLAGPSARSGVWHGVARVLRERLYGPEPVIHIVALDDGTRLHVNIAEREGGNLYFGRPYEDLEREVIRAVVTPGATAIDVGANVGVYTLLLSRLVGASGSVHAFEPASRTFELLRRNVDLAAAANVRLFREAASESAGSRDLFLNYESGLAAVVPTGRGCAIGAETVTAVTLDAHCAEHGLDTVELLKIDVEGHEGHVLRGAADLLRRSDRITVLAELDTANFGPLGYAVDEVIAWMSSLGFTAWNVARHGRLVRMPHPRPTGNNFVFTSAGTSTAAALARFE